tara:strand:- start:577 stop:918 length:342 start_codon:yes stop_codon:yes gene_type:complete
MAAVIFAESKEKPAERVGIPSKGFDAGVGKYNRCPLDQSDLHGQRCRKALKDMYLPAVLLRVSAQIWLTIATKLRGPDPGAASGVDEGFARRYKPRSELRNICLKRQVRNGSP